MYRRIILGLVGLALAGCALPAPSSGNGATKTGNGATPAAQPRQSSTTTAPSAGTTTATCVPETTDSYQRPYSATAPWNVPVCGLAQDPRSADWANRFYYYAHYNRYMGSNPASATDSAQHDVEFGLDADPNNDFSVAVYDAADATTTARVFQRSGWNGGFNVGNGGSIPWNPSWRASTGSDAILVIINHTTGEEWALWGLVQSEYGMPANDTQCWQYIPYVWLPGGGYHSGTDLCAGGANHNRTADGTALENVFTYGGNNPGARGVGIDEYAMLVTPQEVATGQIRHALMMPVFDTMQGGAGEVCSAAQLTTSAFGSTCGGAVAPAGNFENSSNGAHGCASMPAGASLSDTAYRQTTIPEGTRFALNLSEQDIDNWLDSRGYTGTLRTTAKAFADALVNYGWFITDTSCYAADFQVSGGSNPDTAAAWRNLGIVGDGRSLLQGLITKDDVWTVAPPTNHCTNGTSSHFACAANTISYP